MAKLFSLALEKFGGLHLNQMGEVPISDGESPDMKNFRITENGQLKLREGFRVLHRLNGPVRCLWQGTLNKVSLFLALVGKTLYRSFDGFENLEPIGEIEGEERISCLEFREKLYFLTGETILVCDGEKLEEITPYRPLIRIASPPEGGGTPFEAVNFLSGQVRQTFSADGKTQIFHLISRAVESVDYVLLNGEELPKERYFAEPNYGTVQIFGEVAEFPPDAGTENVEIGYTLAPETLPEPLFCRHGITYGGENDTRAFLYANPDKPALRYYSGIADGLPTMSYFPVTNVSMVGDGEAITSIVRHYDRQIIFTPHSTYYSYPEVQTEETGRQYTSFPIYTLSAMKGNIVPGLALLADNKPLSVMPSGLYLWSNTSVRDERNAHLFSEAISPALRSEDLSDARIYLRASTSEIYLALSRGIYVYNLKSRLFYYYEGFSPNVMLEDETNRFFFGTKSGEICLTEGHLDDTKGIDAHWESSALFCGDRAHTKNLFDITLGVNADAAAPLIFSWRTDNATSRKDMRIRQSPLLDFGAPDFANFSLETARRSKARKIKIGAKRFESVTLRITHPPEESDLCITHLILRGKICDQHT